MLKRWYLVVIPLLPCIALAVWLRWPDPEAPPATTPDPVLPASKGPASPGRLERLDAGAGPRESATEMAPAAAVTPPPAETQAPKTDLDFKRGWLESALKDLNDPAKANFIEPQLERALVTAIAIELDRQGRGELRPTDGVRQDLAQPGMRMFFMNERVYHFPPGEFPAYDELNDFRELRAAWSQKAANYPLNSPEGNPANEPQIPGALVESVRDLARNTLARSSR